MKVNKTAGRDTSVLSCPELYDPQIDSFRPITQKDVDRLCALAQAYGKILTVMMEQHVKIYGESARGKAFKKLLNSMGASDAAK